MSKHHTKYTDRRSAFGKWKPMFFLLLEITALLMLCWLVSLFKFAPLTFLMMGFSVYIFITSSFPRYKKVVKRQKYSQY